MSMKYGPSSSSSSTTWTLKCTDLPQFDALLAAAENFRTDDKLHLRNLCNDTSRCAGLTAVVYGGGASAQSGTSPVSATPHQPRKIILDYSRQRVNGETMELLYDLADAVNFVDRREAMRAGEAINVTEDRAVLHHVLRMPDVYEPIHTESFKPESIYSLPPTTTTRKQMTQRQQQPQHNNSGKQSVTSHHDVNASSTTSTTNKQVDARQVFRDVQDMRRKIRDFSEAVRSGRYHGITGQVFRTILCVGTGGHYLGPQFVSTALQADPTAKAAAQSRRLRFLVNVDPVHFHECTSDLDPAETLVILSSFNFTDSDCVLNSKTIRNWLLQGLLPAASSPTKPLVDAAAILARHVMAISNNIPRCVQFGVAKENIFYLWDWISSRYSVCSAVGMLPLSIQYSYDVMKQFLSGAHHMDEHFFYAPLRDNIPVIMGLLTVWNSTFLGYSCRAILPYSHALRDFPPLLQKIDMESNSKRVALDGTPLLHHSSPIVFGDCGTSAQSAFFQLLHQGRAVPIDFIGFMEPQQSIDLPGEAVNSHDELMSNFFAQPDALAYGKTLVDLMQEGAPEPLREHMVLTGNRPSSNVLLTKLDAFGAGQLLAMYEHSAAVVGFVWGINSFDQYGLELGRMLAKTVRAQLSASRKTGASVQGFNYSTSNMLEHYLAQGKYSDKAKYGS